MELENRWTMSHAAGAAPASPDWSRPPRSREPACTRRRRPLKDMIVRGVLPAGAPLVEKDLSIALGFSRTRCGKPSSSWRQRVWSSCIRTGARAFRTGSRKRSSNCSRHWRHRAADRGTRRDSDLRRPLGRTAREAGAARLHAPDKVLDAYFALNQEIHRNRDRCPQPPLAEATRRSRPGPNGHVCGRSRLAAVGRNRLGNTAICSRLSTRAMPRKRAPLPIGTCCAPVSSSPIP